MAIENLEDTLKNMTKPDVKELKHEAALSKMVLKVNARSAVSFWWLCIPLYIIAALIMKSYFVPNASFISALRAFTNSRSYTAVLLFLVLPFFLILISLVSIKQLFFLFNSLTKEALLKKISIQILIILLSLIVSIIYFL